MLALQDVHAYYGNIHALKGLTLQVEKVEIVTLIGANGAGKSTTIRTITGLLHPRRGQIKLEGESIAQLLPHQIVQRGVAQAPEGRRIFPRLTVLENLDMGAYSRRNRRRCAAIWIASCSFSLVSRNVPHSRAARFQAASSKCWPSAAP